MFLGDFDVDVGVDVGCVGCGWCGCCVGVGGLV